jgi:hypothetical protein
MVLGGRGLTVESDLSIWGPGGGGGYTYVHVNDVFHLCVPICLSVYFHACSFETLLRVCMQTCFRACMHRMCMYALVTSAYMLPCMTSRLGVALLDPIHRQEPHPVKVGYSFLHGSEDFVVFFSNPSFLMPLSFSVGSRQQTIL